MKNILLTTKKHALNEKGKYFFYRAGIFSSYSNKSYNQKFQFEIKAFDSRECLIDIIDSRFQFRMASLVFEIKMQMQSIENKYALMPSNEIRVKKICTQLKSRKNSMFSRRILQIQYFVNTLQA